MITGLLREKPVLHYLSSVVHRDTVEFGRIAWTAEWLEILNAVTPAITEGDDMIHRQSGCLTACGAMTIGQHYQILPLFRSMPSRGVQFGSAGKPSMLATAFHRPRLAIAFLLPLLHLRSLVVLVKGRLDFGFLSALALKLSIVLALARSAIGCEPILIANMGAKLGGWFHLLTASTLLLFGLNALLPILGSFEPKGCMIAVLTAVLAAAPKEEMVGAAEDLTATEAGAGDAAGGVDGILIGHRKLTPFDVTPEGVTAPLGLFHGSHYTIYRVAA